MQLERKDTLKEDLDQDHISMNILADESITFDFPNVKETNSITTHIIPISDHEIKDSEQLWQNLGLAYEPLNCVVSSSDSSYYPRGTLCAVLNQYRIRISPGSLQILKDHSKTLSDELNSQLTLALGTICIIFVIISYVTYFNVDLEPPSITDLLIIAATSSYLLIYIKEYVIIRNIRNQVHDLSDRNLNLENLHEKLSWVSLKRNMEILGDVNQIARLLLIKLSYDILQFSIMYNEVSSEIYKQVDRIKLLSLKIKLGFIRDDEGNVINKPSISICRSYDNEKDIHMTGFLNDMISYNDTAIR
jgi:hypothetical protein